jgi:hypothetical protein
MRGKAGELTAAFAELILRHDFQSFFVVRRKMILPLDSCSSEK